MGHMAAWSPFVHARTNAATVSRRSSFFSSVCASRYAAPASAASTSTTPSTPAADGPPRRRRRADLPGDRKTEPARGEYPSEPYRRRRRRATATGLPRRPDGERKLTSGPLAAGIRIRPDDAPAASSPLRRPVAPADAAGRAAAAQSALVTGGPVSVSLSAPSGAPLSRRLEGSTSSPVRDLLKLAARPEVISLAGGLPAPETFDVAGLRDAFAEVLSGPDAVRALQYSTTEGDPALRARLAAVIRAGGLPASADDMLVTTGSQQALGLIAAALLNPGDTVLVEDPTYLAALQAFGLADARIVPIPNDEEGPVPGALAELAARERARFAYLIPTFQNPTGRTLSAERRAALAEAAATAGLWLVEDDPYSALRLDGEPVDLLATHPAARDRTIVMQTLSKVLSPGLRLGYRRVPESIYGAVAIAKQAADLHSSTVTQLAAERWLAAHDLAAHIRGLAAHYRPRRDALLAGLAEHLPEGSAWTTPAGGLFIWVTLPPGHDAEAVLARAIERGVAFVPGGYFYAAQPRPETLRVSFATASPEELDEGAARLGEAIAG